MREHQIVITLKPEQFLMVQKLARDSGAKSMGMFVRQQLLAALGLEGQGASSSPAETNLEPVVNELKRLHEEVKAFVAESLSSYDSFDNPLPAGNVEADEGTGLSIVSDDPQASPLFNDEFESIADKTFAISPRLGALEPIDRLSLRKQGRETAEEGGQSLSSPANLNETALVDDLQAGKKTASEKTEPLRDPLVDLLDDRELQSDGKPDAVGLVSDDDSSFDVPLSILTRRKQLEAQKKALESSSALAQNEKAEDSKNKTVPAKTDKPASSAGAAEESVAPVRKEDSGSVIREISTDDSEGDIPLSGGPPPKKQK